MKIYGLIIFELAMFALFYGFVIPSLVSASDSIAVISGFATAFVIAPAIMWYAGKFFYNKLIKKEGKK